MQVQAGQIGLPIVYEVRKADDTPRDISGFTTTELVFERPDKSTMVKPAMFETDGSDGLLIYTTVAGDILPHGSFCVQAHLADLTHDEYTEVAVFHASANLVTP